MPGLVPGIHASGDTKNTKKNVHGRDEPGHAAVANAEFPSIIKVINLLRPD